MSTQTKLIAGTIVVAALAAAGAAFAAVELSSTSHSTAPQPTTPFGQGISGSGLGGGRLGGRGFGGGLGAGRGGFRPGFGGRGFGDTSAAAYLGLSASALQTQLDAGKTLAQIAKVQGKPVAGLIAAMVAAQKKRLASAVASGFLTEDQAKQLASLMAERMKDLVNGVRPKFGPGGSGSGGSGSFGLTS